MFVHSKCLYRLKLNLNNTVIVLSEISLNRNGIVPGISDIFSSNKSESKEVPFYCLECGESVIESEVFGICEYCGHMKSLTELFKVGEVPGVFCDFCINERELNTEKKEVIPITDIMKLVEPKNRME